MKGKNKFFHVFNEEQRHKDLRSTGDVAHLSTTLHLKKASVFSAKSSTLKNETTGSS
jgi:hypothetical protein